MKTAFGAISFFLGFAIFPATKLAAQVRGCTDRSALNYNSTATVNDGSCTYPRVKYSPQLKIDLLPSVLEESSGLQWAGGSLWSFNDGGNAALLFRLDTTTGTVLQTVALEGITNVDWEDIAFDGSRLYLGDFGNNAGNRDDLKIYAFPLAAIPYYQAEKAVTIPAAQIETINFRYADDSSTVSSGTNKAALDCEAMIIDGGKIHLFTKNWRQNTTTHYVINSTRAGSYVAEPMETLATGYLVTAADKVPCADTVILIGYQASGNGAHFLHLLTGFSGGLYFNGNKRKVYLPGVAEIGQVEGIAFCNGSYGFISNEKFERSLFGLTLTVSPKLHRFHTDLFAGSAVAENK
ncbi:MAG: hypothetical protein EOO14_13570 [Chitinophagaceae bacterium]|nr:MAG: hypothetical protein EOO14_13570 [Chitinophagaceae bacterium]